MCITTALCNLPYFSRSDLYAQNIEETLIQTPYILTANECALMHRLSHSFLFKSMVLLTLELP